MNDSLPAPGDSCLCCRNLGVLPAPRVNGQPVHVPGAVDSSTALQCCDECLAAIAFGVGKHPHKLNLAGLGLSS